MSTPQPRLFQQPVDIDQRQVPISLIVPPPEHTPIMPGLEHQPIAQSVLLKETGDPTLPYQIVDGHRRIASAIRFGIESVPALITDGSRGQLAALGAILNASRSPNYLDEARNWHTALEEGQFATVEELAADVNVDVREIRARLKMLSLPETVLSEVGGLIKEGTAVRMSRLPDEYREQAVNSALNRITAGERFTAADLKAVSMQRREDREAALSGLFPDLQPALIERDPLAELADEVCRLSHIAGIPLAQLIAVLGTRQDETDGEALPEMPQASVAAQAADEQRQDPPHGAQVSDLALDDLFGAAGDLDHLTDAYPAMPERGAVSDAFADTGELDLLDMNDTDAGGLPSSAVDAFDFGTPLSPAAEPGAGVPAAVTTPTAGRAKLGTGRAGRATIGQRHLT